MSKSSQQSASALVADIRSLLNEEGISQSDIAKAAGVSQPLISRVLSGDYGVLRPATQVRLEKLLDTPKEDRVRLFQSLRMRDIFISHASIDKPFVKDLVANLKTPDAGGRHLTVWLDEAEIEPGQSVPGMINLGLETSRFVAIVMTPAYFESFSGWTDAEWHAALHKDPDNRRGHLLPLLVADCPYIPVLLRHLLRIDLRGPKYSDGMDRLLKVLRDEPIPRPLTVRGQLIRPSGTIDRASLVAERAVPDAYPDAVEENLSCNLLPVEKLPRDVYSAPVSDHLWRQRKRGTKVPPSKAEIKRAIRQDQEDAGIDEPRMPAFRLAGNRIVTFHDVESPDSTLYGVVNTEEVELDRSQSFVADEDDRRILVSLLNMGIARHLLARGLEADSTKANRFFFPALGRAKREVEWKPFRKTTKRAVAKPYKQGNRLLFWLHQAAYIKAIFLASRFYIQITPTWLLTEDGKRVKGGSDVGRVIVKWTGQERNISVLYHVRFWASVLRTNRDSVLAQSALRPGPGPIWIRMGDQALEVSALPAFVHQAYGIESDQRDLMTTLDEEAPRIAIQEDLAELEDRDEESDIGLREVEELFPDVQEEDNDA